MPETDIKLRTHVPGPWSFAPNKHQVAVFAGQMKICDIRGWGHLTGGGALNLPLEEAASIQDANARLIAAAPDLCKATEALCHLVRCMMTGPGWTQDLADGVLQAADAALEKAKGTEHALWKCE